MSKLLYMDCYGGFNSNIACGALMELGADPNYAESQLSALFPSLPYPQVEKITVANQGIFATEARIQRQGNLPEYSLSQARELVLQANMDIRVKKFVCDMLDILLTSECEKYMNGRVTQSLIKMTAAASFAADLGIDKISFSAICEGHGCIKIEDNILPIPLPGVVNIASRCHMKFSYAKSEKVYITETDAAIAAGLCDDFSYVPSDYQILRCGVGADESGGVLRALILETEEIYTEKTESVWVLETNIDDASGEQLGYAIDLLMKAGARDASAMPILMKKNRPAFLLQVICTESDRDKLEDIIFHETTSIGLRRYQEHRHILPRTFERVMTPFGEVTCKVCTHHGVVFKYPEYEDVARIARETGKSFTEIYNLVKLTEK